MRDRTSAWRRAAGLLWELPQSTLGALAFVASLVARRARSVTLEDGRLFVELGGEGAVSLGHVVMWSSHDGPFVPVGPENRSHERGHAVQSRLLGPLYLPLVGVPSVARVLYAIAHKTVTGRRWAGYYDGYPERWADELGGVDRSLRPKP